MTLPKISRRKMLLFLMGIAVIGGVIGTVVWWSGSKNDNQYGELTKEIREGQKKMNEVRMGEEEANKSKKINDSLAEVNQLANQSKFTEAKSKLDILLKEHANDETTKQAIYSLYVTVCQSLKDVACMDQTAEYYKTNDTFYVSVNIQFGANLRQGGDAALARKYYANALAVIEKNGGQKFIDSFNKASQELQINYNEIKEAAK